jgi:glycine/D-amino acid oxidase-like deaminating enzyme
MAKDKDEAARDDFLDRCKVDAGLELYAIGLSERGITLYKQQVRALNLIYALHETDKLGETIAVIGGGAAGATAALAAATLGYSVSIFEQRPTLFHLQQGCDIRWLHPHIYDWPASGSDGPYAGLPLLDWEFATAAEVAARLQAGWDAEVKPDEDDEGGEEDDDEEENADEDNGDEEDDEEEDDDGEDSGLDITLHTRASAYFAGICLARPTQAEPCSAAGVAYLRPVPRL